MNVDGARIFMFYENDNSVVLKGIERMECRLKKILTYLILVYTHLGKV